MRFLHEDNYQIVSMFVDPEVKYLSADRIHGGHDMRGLCLNCEEQTAES